MKSKAEKIAENKELYELAIGIIKEWPEWKRRLGIDIDAEEEKVAEVARNEGCHSCVYFQEGGYIGSIGDCCHKSNLLVLHLWSGDKVEFLSSPLNINQKRDCKNFEENVEE